MHILVDETCRVTLDDADDFQSFSVVVAAPRAAAPSVTKALAAAGLRLEDGHCWVPQAWLRADNGAPRPDDWQAKFDGMIAYAAKKGWIDEATGDVRAHVTWQD
jgi:hypothetical protein